MKKKIIISIGCFLGIVCLAFVINRLMVNYKISCCVERTFDIIQAINRKDDEKMNQYLDDLTLIESDYVIADKKNAVNRLNRINIDIVSAEVHNVAIHGNEVRIMCSMEVVGDREGSGEWFVYDTSHGKIRLYEIVGFDIFRYILLNEEESAFPGEHQYSHMFDFPKQTECSYTADYDRLH